MHNGDIPASIYIAAYLLISQGSPRMHANKQIRSDLRGGFSFIAIIPKWLGSLFSKVVSVTALARKVENNVTRGDFSFENTLL
jgi:hypothetical protein